MDTQMEFAPSKKNGCVGVKDMIESPRKRKASSKDAKV
jgi:hypothetical protein